MILSEQLWIFIEKIHVTSAMLGNSIPRIEVKNMEKYDRGCGGKGLFALIWDDWDNTAGVDVKDNVPWKCLQNEFELQHLS